MADHPLAASVEFLPREEKPAQENGPTPIPMAARLAANQRPSLHGRARSDVFGDALDLADPANRLGTSPDINSRIEQKRLEHERQRAAQKNLFDEQMRALAEKQAREEQELLNKAKPSSSPKDPVHRPPSVSMPVSPDSSSGEASPGVNGTAAPLAQRSISKNSANDEPRKVSDAKSMPASRRHSGEADTAAVAEGMSKLTVNGAKVPAGDTPLLTNFLFDDELEADLQNSAFGGKYLQMNNDDDKFPILVRRDSFPGMLSASSAALDLAPLSQTPPRHGFRGFDAAARTSEWPPFAGHRPTVTNGGDNNTGVTPTSPHGRTITTGSLSLAPERNSPTTSRHLPPPGRTVSVDVPLSSSTSATSVVAGRSTSPAVELTTPKKTSPAASSSPEDKRRSLIGHAGSAPALGPPQSRDELSYTVDGARPGQSAFAQFAASQQSPNLVMNQASGPSGANGYAYDPYGGSSFGKSTVPYGLRGNVPKPLGDSTNRFSGLRLEDLQGDMASLCKDQHGCRFLQRKLEEGKPEHRDMIYAEIFPVFADLMTDPFANYLAQRLLEFSTDEQRDGLIESISGNLVAISLNMHGTRAVQKMIDFLSTRRQVQSLILALNLNVVALIKDLNGNHVIQKCLNTLPPEDNQFIYNAVAANCIEVATHRHGCCVLQRCIDHASESQRIQLVTEITYQSLSLVQDAFGNYVVQYIVDCDSRFAEAIVRQFLGNVSTLSCQKFSSNVVEKCIRVSDAVGRKALIDELLDRNALERLINDPFGNYVLQTCIDYAEGPQRGHLINTLRPMMPAIRNTPHGKRIQQKIQRDGARHDAMRGGLPGFHGGHIGQGMPPGMYGGYGGYGGPPPPQLAMHPHQQHHVSLGHPSQASLMHPGGDYGRSFSMPGHTTPNGTGSAGGSPTQPFTTSFGGGGIVGPALFGPPHGGGLEYAPFAPFH